RGLTQAGRAVEEYMAERLLELAAGVQRDAEALHDRSLADDLAQPARSQGGVALTFVFRFVRLNNGLTCHENLTGMSQSPGGRRAPGGRGAGGAPAGGAAAGGPGAARGHGCL